MASPTAGIPRMCQRALCVRSEVIGRSCLQQTICTVCLAGHTFALIWNNVSPPPPPQSIFRPATEMDIITDGSILMLGVLYNGKPQDAASVCRVCVVSCKDVPILEEQPANCNPTSLPLFVIQYASKGPLRELAYRHETKDTEASQFYQYLTQTLQVSVSIPQ